MKHEPSANSHQLWADFVSGTLAGLWKVLRKAALGVSVVAVGIMLVVATAAATRASPRDAGMFPSEQVGAEEKQELARIKTRFAEHKRFLEIEMMTAAHVFRSADEARRFPAFVAPFGKALEDDNPAAMLQSGGTKAFKRGLVRFLDSDEEAASAAAAILLGVIGDSSYAPTLAEQLRKPVKKDGAREEGEYDIPILRRGRAATALGLLGARQYAEQLAALLKSKSFFDRQGAIIDSSVKTPPRMYGRDHM
ncbi:MAG: hypothetical protein HY897_08275 [Deltaproteobacteria bacterium]|nr:hypothetical protein [Deltaproteobacteria bacterium]